MDKQYQEISEIYHNSDSIGQSWLRARIEKNHYMIKIYFKKTCWCEKSEQICESVNLNFCTGGQIKQMHKICNI